MRLFLVRHGETSWNRAEIFRGRIDVKLNEHGVEQARRTAAILSALNLAAVYSSPLSRALETARYIAEPHGLPVIVEDGLTDLDYGKWQGLTHEEVKEQYVDLYRLWNTAPHKVRFEEGESLEDVRRRALEALDRIAARHNGQNVVAVSHRVVTKVVLCALLGLDTSHFWHIRQDPCAVNVLEYSDRHGFVICRLNDTCHIKPFYKGMETIDF